MNEEQRAVQANITFRSTLDWFMSADPWPYPEDLHDMIKERLDAEAIERGYDDWIEAFHRFVGPEKYDTDPEATVLAEVRKILTTELWVMEHWDEVPAEHRLIILHALAMDEARRLAEWRFER